MISGVGGGDACIDPLGKLCTVTLRDTE